MEDLSSPSAAPRIAEAAGPPAGRRDNRRRVVLDAAAGLFREHGYEASSMRDIAGAAGVRPSSIYYFFDSKEELLAAVYAEGVAEITAVVRAALDAAGDAPAWDRLEAAAVAHLRALHSGGDYATVVVNALPRRDQDLHRRLAAHRDAYEAIFKELVAALPLPPGIRRGTLRLALLGALNWTTTWYRPDGDQPAAIARRIVAMLRRPLDRETQP